MLFGFNLHSSLLLPFAVPGLVAVAGLLARAWQRAAAPDAWLALLILIPTLSVMQWMLGFAGWYNSHDGHSTCMFYIPWRLGLFTGPAYYLYFRSLTRADNRQVRAWRHLAPGLAHVGLFAGVVAYDLLWWRGLRHQPLPDFFGTEGRAATFLNRLELPLDLAGYALLLVYTIRLLSDHQRYRHYLDDNFSDPERLRFAGLRQLLLLQVVGLGIGLVFTGVNGALSLSYQAAWYFFALQGALIYGLIVVGLQANYAAASSPLRFGSSAALLPPKGPSATAALQDDPVEVSSWASTSPPLDSGVETAAAGALQPVLAVGLAPELQAQRDRLVQLMDAAQPWLRSELTLTELAQALELSPGALSRVINTSCGCNFSDFVNGYRVRAATARLADPRYQHYSLVGVAFDCGFNSKSTFNRVFRKLAGYPPSEVVRPNS